MAQITGIGCSRAEPTTEASGISGNQNRSGQGESLTLRVSLLPACRLIQPLDTDLVSASDCDARASKQVGRRSGVNRNIHTGRRNSRTPALPQLLPPEEEHIAPGAAVAAARNCNWARERGKVQSYLCRRSSADQFQTRMRTQPMSSRNISFPYRIVPAVIRRFNPAMTAKLPWKIIGMFLATDEHGFARILKWL